VEVSRCLEVAVDREDDFVGSGDELTFSAFGGVLVGELGVVTGKLDVLPQAIERAAMLAVIVPKIAIRACNVGVLLVPRIIRGEHTASTSLTY
jgi:hypothetical protein